MKLASLAVLFTIHRLTKAWWIGSCHLLEIAFSCVIWTRFACWRQRKNSLFEEECVSNCVTNKTSFSVSLIDVCTWSFTFQVAVASLKWAKVTLVPTVVLELLLFKHWSSRPSFLFRCTCWTGSEISGIVDVAMYPLCQRLITVKLSSILQRRIMIYSQRLYSEA